MPNSTNDISIFLEQWEIYQQVVNSNFMSHQQIASHLNTCITKHFTKAFSLLDLGCGDASMMASVLKNSEIQSYFGVDLSKAAMDLAIENTRNNDINSDFLVSDLKSFGTVIKNQTFDMIIAGFSLHHLSEKEKEYFFVQCKHALNKNGKLIIYDVVRQNDETRDVYLSRYCASVTNSWIGLSQQALTVIKQHITSSDYPQSLQELEVMSQYAGFNKLDVLYKDSVEFHYLLLIS